MSESTAHTATVCVSCGVNIAGMSAAQFECPVCDAAIARCATCRKQSNLYECPACNFVGP